LARYGLTLHQQALLQPSFCLNLMLPTVPSSNALAFESHEEATQMEKRSPLRCLASELRAGFGRQVSEMSTACSEDGESAMLHAPRIPPKTVRWGTGCTTEFERADATPPISRPFDPFHRTASERRLCGGLVADDVEDSPLQQEAWPPRASAVLALEAFGRILDEHEHFRHPADDDPEGGFFISSPIERTDVPASFYDDDGISTPDHSQCAPLCGLSAVSQDSLTEPEDSCQADDTDSMPETDSYSFFRSLFWGTRPAVKCADPELRNEDQLPAPASAAPVDCTSSLNKPTHIQGAIVLSGSIEENPAAICQALRQALSDVLAQLSPTKITVSCEWARVESEMTESGIQIRCHEFRGNSRSVMIIEPDSHIKFFFTAHLLDPLDDLAALDALRLESACAGAWRFLPALVDSLGDARRLSVRLEVGLATDDEQPI